MSEILRLDKYNDSNNTDHQNLGDVYKNKKFPNDMYLVYLIKLKRKALLFTEKKDMQNLTEMCVCVCFFGNYYFVSVTINLHVDIMRSS